MRLLLATTNQGKVREIRELLAGVPLELRTLDDYPDIPAPEESGATFADNARLKALYYAAATGLSSVAEDSGLEIDALDGAPGVHSARFGGIASTYPEKFAILYRALQSKGAGDATARFVCALAVARAGSILFEARGVIEGRIAPEPSGDGGFGYDPIFFYPPFGQTLAEAGARKSTVSHRGQAFRELKRWLKGRTGPGSIVD
ncbi:MAG: non-canonical purine NTP pyrophosphatase [Vicinamibacterales bacterium]